MSRRGVRVAVTTALGVALVIGMTSPAGASPPAAKQEPAEKSAPVKPVRAAEYKPAPRTPDLAVDMVETPRVSWPAKGSAQVTLPAVSWAAKLSGVLPKKPAGVLPVAVGPAKADGSAPAAVKVDLLGRRDSSLLVRLTSTTKATGKVALELDYGAFRYGYGGDWASRLRLVQLPACAEQQPASAGCVGKPIPTRNTGSGKLTADVPANGLFAMEAAAGGPAGDFSQSQLAPSAAWSVGGSSGDFNWQYPLRTPPGTGGPTPTVGLAYSSGSVDGRTSATNNQTSWVGEGFQLAPGGAIERKYASCASKSEKTGNNGSRQVGDLCFATDNATFTLNGRGGELVRDDGTGQWRPKNDDGTKVERLSGADNGDQGGTAAERGEYWVITTTDGVKYYFGLNKLPSAGSVATNSAWKVPVAGNHAGEQCHQAAFAGSFCDQVYAWNLDYVEDQYGNTMSLFYETEKNNYAYNGTETTTKSYDRAGNILRIEYGQTKGQVFTEKAVARVHFDTTQRCLTGTTCTSAGYVDTPLDQECGTDRCSRTSPTFWTKKKLSKVRTEVWRGDRFDAVDTWNLRYSFPDPGDNTAPRLWLDGITHTGEVGDGAVNVPEVNFDKIALSNRVPDGTARPLLDWFRIKAIHYGTGGDLVIGYSEKDCKSSPGDVPPIDDNKRRCYPMKWTPPDATAEETGWFHKYVVTSVSENDRAASIPGQPRPTLDAVLTTISYGTPAWRHDDEDGLVEIGKKTWSQWRGYDKVTVTKGHSAGTQSVTEHRYFQGMDGDKRLSGPVKDVVVEDSTGATVDDLNALAGQERETSKKIGTAIAERTIADPWVSKATSTRAREWGTTQSFKVEQAGVRQWTAKPNGEFQQTAARNKYNETGQLLESTNSNDLASTTDDTCTRYEYAANPALGLVELLTRAQVVAKACDKPWTTADVVSDKTLSYPGGATPTSSNPTETKRLSGFDSTGKALYQTVSTLTYDDHGRRKSETDAEKRTTSYSYSPADGPVTRTTVQLANGHTSSTKVDPAWGQSVEVTDVGGRTTISQRDPLGRIAKVWLPGRAGAATPDVEHRYFGGVDAATGVETLKLRPDGSTERSVELYDGLQRKRQVQQSSPDGVGRIVTDIQYDSRGLKVIETRPYFVEGAPGDTVLHPVEEELPARRATAYDALERPVKEAFWTFGTERWSMAHSHEPDRQTVNPPTGEQATTRIVDSQGRPTELRTYNTPDPSTSFDRTRYSYDSAGRLATVTDPAGNQWKYTYDLRGRRIEATEPDRGTTKYTYNETDQITSTEDANGKKLFFGYDAIGRPTTVRENSETGPLRIERTYDTLVPGSLTSATRWVNGNPYRTEVTGYTASGHPKGTTITLPAAEGALADRTYTIENTYTATGKLETTKLPGVGGLPAETLTTKYDAAGLPIGLSSEHSSYVTGTQFNAYGDLTNLEVRPTNGKALRHTYVYDRSTRRLNRTYSLREEGTPQRVLDQTYSYDHAGNVTKIVDAPASGSTDPKDIQCFNYDEARRLTQAWTPSSGNCAVQPTSAGELGGPAPYWHQWTFDAIGNRMSEKRTSSAGVTTSSYDYADPGEAGPHAVEKITTTGPGGSTKVNTYGYDAAGNQISRTVNGVAETFTFDAEGKLGGVEGGGKTTSYIYDADGNRLLRKDKSGTTLYFGGNELLLMPDGSQLGTRYYQFGKQTIGVRVGTKLTWLGSDHHGSATLMVDAETQAYQRKRITPYGETRGPVPADWPGQRDFVGGTKDPTTGLVHLGAREYDPVAGRFISVDPVVDPQDPQQLNSYAYANNSPVSFVDADGLRYRTEIVTETIIEVKVLIRQIREWQVRMVTIYIAVVVLTFVAKFAAAFGMHEFAQAVTRMIAVQVATLKEVIRNIRENITVIRKKITRKLVYEADPVSGHTLNGLLWDATSAEGFVNGVENKVDKLHEIAEQIGKRAKEDQLAAEVNKKLAEEQAKKNNEQKTDSTCSSCNLDNGDVDLTRHGVFSVAGGILAGAVCVATAGAGCLAAGIATAAGTMSTGVGWNRINGPLGDLAAKNADGVARMTPEERMHWENPCSNIYAGC